MGRKMKEQMEKVVEEERQVLESLLASTGKNFTEDTADNLPLPGILANFRFTFENGDVAAHVFVIENAQARQDALEWLMQICPNDNEPLVSYNGRLVFAVQYKGKQSDNVAYTARDIASALGGEEE